MAHEYLSRKPFDLYALHLFHLMAKHRSFTQAAREAGLSQSAMTRQMQALENRLGIDLITRTTRSVELTEAGLYLATESARLLGGVAATLEGLQAGYALAKPVVRVGVSRSVPMAHMPGLFHGNQQRAPEVSCSVSYQHSGEILTALEQQELDVGVLCPPAKLPESLIATHRFKDGFALIASRALAERRPQPKRGDKAAALLAWLPTQPWLMIHEGSVTGQMMRRWLKRQSLRVEAAMELDSFDLIINLVASGMGVALVPQRALALYRRRSAIVRLEMKPMFSRELVVLARRHRKLPEHVQGFIQNVLF